MKKVFISSVIQKFDSFRQIAKSAVELMDLKPIMAEQFGSRTYSSETACASEVLNSDIYLLVMGRDYGFITSQNISVTQSEYLIAKNAGKPILAFVQKCDMDERQTAFKKEIEDYNSGLFRGSFSTPDELKDQILRSLRQIEQESRSKSDIEFLDRVKVSLKDLTYRSSRDPLAIIAFWNQPVNHIDLDSIETDFDAIFGNLCKIGVTKMKNGYETVSKANAIILRSKNTHYLVCDDGLKILCYTPENDRTVFSLAFYYVSPSDFEHFAKESFSLNDSKIAWAMVGLMGMESRYFSEPITGNSTTVPMYNQESELASKFFNPISKAAYEEWVQAQTKRFKRIFSKQRTT